MAPARFTGKVVYYGGYPGSSGKPVAGRLRWAGDVLQFEPATPSAPAYRLERARLRGVRRSEEGLTGARRIRLLIDVETENHSPATLKFEMGGLFWKERKLARWLEILEPACAARKDDHV